MTVVRSGGFEGEDSDQEGKGDTAPREGISGLDREGWGEPCGANHGSFINIIGLCSLPLGPCAKVVSTFRVI